MIKLIQQFDLYHEHTANHKQMAIFHYLHAARGNFVVGRLNFLGVPKYVHTDDAICSWKDVGDLSCRSMEWNCVFPQQEKVSPL